MKLNVYSHLLVLLLFFIQEHTFSGGLFQKNKPKEYELKENFLVQTKEGTQYFIAKKALEQSQTIQQMLQDYATKTADVIPLVEITGKEFEIIRPYLYNPKEQFPKEIMQLATLAKTANYLAIEPLLDTIVAKIAEDLPGNYEKIFYGRDWVEELGLPNELLVKILASAKQKNLQTNSFDINELVVLANFADYLHEESYLNDVHKRLAVAFELRKNLEKFLNNKEWLKTLSLPKETEHKIAQKILLWHPEFIGDLLEKVEVSSKVFLNESRVESLALTPNGKNVFAGSPDGTITMWDLETDQKRKTLKIPHSNEKIYSLAITPNGQRLVSGSRNRIDLWDIETGENLATLKADSDKTPLLITLDGEEIISGSLNDIIIWEIATGKKLVTITGHSKEVKALAMMPNGEQFVSISNDRTIRIWDVRTGINLKTLRDNAPYEVFFESVAVTPDGNYIICGTNKAIKKLDVKEGNSTAFPEFSGYVFSLALTHDGKYLASGLLHENIVVWDVKTRQYLKTLKGHEKFSRVNSVVMTPQGKLISGSSDSTIRIWDIERLINTYEKVKTDNLDQVLFLASLSILKNIDYKNNIHVLELVKSFDPEIQKIIFKNYGPSWYQTMVGWLSRNK